MNPITLVRAWWREWRRDRRDDPIVTAEMAEWAEIRKAMGGSGVASDTGTVQPTAEELKQIRPTDALDRRIEPEKLKARDHDPADKPGHRVAPDPTDEEVTVDG